MNEEPYCKKHRKWIRLERPEKCPYVRCIREGCQYFDLKKPSKLFKKRMVKK